MYSRLGYIILDYIMLYLIKFYYIRVYYIILYIYNMVYYILDQLNARIHMYVIMDIYIERDIHTCVLSICAYG